MQTFQAAMQRDSDAAADIKSRGRRLTHLQDSLGEWRTKLAADRKVSCVSLFSFLPSQHQQVNCLFPALPLCRQGSMHVSM